MQNRIDVPKYKIDTDQAVKDTLKKQLLEQFYHMANGTTFSLRDMIEEIEENFPEIKNNPMIKKEAVSEFRNVIANQISNVNGNMIVDRNRVVYEEIEALKQREEALNLAKEAIAKLEQQGKTITKDSIVDYLENIDFRNRKYKTWIGILSTSGTLPGLQKETEAECR